MALQLDNRLLAFVELLRELIDLLLSLNALRLKLLLVVALQLGHLVSDLLPKSGHLVGVALVLSLHLTDVLLLLRRHLLVQALDFALFGFDLV